MKPKPIFVIDTNVAISYPNIIPNGADTVPDEPTVDTSGAHIVMPIAVIHELSKFKKESSERGEASRKILRRIRKIVEDKGLKMEDVYDLKAPVEFESSDRLFSILPVHRNFIHAGGFHPSEKDMDDQIILTTLYAKEHAPNDSEVVLLTNDNGLAICAAGNGIKTSRYGYRYPASYTGRRDNVQVPFDLYHLWDKNHKISLEEWTAAMPDEAPLVPNEFIIMTPLDWAEHIKHLSNIGRYDSKAELIVPLEYAYNFPTPLKHAGHACYAEALCNPDIKIVVASGVAGTGKTFMATAYGLEAAKAGDYMGVVAVIRTQENDGVGYLPGDLTLKLDPNAQPMKMALRNYYIQTDKDAKKVAYGKKEKQYEGGADDKPSEKSVLKRLADRVKLTWENWVEEVAVPHVKGRDFSYTYVLVDEPQDISGKDADTIMKRFGHNGKMVFMGDLLQIHSEYSDEYNNGLSYVSRQLKGDEEVAQILLYPEEVLRDDLVMRIVKRQQEARETARNSGE
ncbi:MAG: PhoH family protein [Candidatus Nomurabacteria bacterium]|nr:PhoH family protein [Candidatus Nomurabacteria bacterium]